MQCCVESADDSSSVSGESEGVGKEGEEEEEEDGAVVVEWRPSGSGSALGEWERHTTVSYWRKGGGGGQKSTSTYTLC